MAEIPFPPRSVVMIRGTDLHAMVIDLPSEGSLYRRVIRLRDDFTPTVRTVHISRLTAVADSVSEYMKQREQEKLREYKRRVMDIARRYTEENDWCGVVDEALKELGVRDTYRVTVRVEYQVTADLMASGVEEDYHQNLDESIRRSIESGTAELPEAENFELDDAWSNDRGQTRTITVTTERLLDRP